MVLAILYILEPEQAPPLPDYIPGPEHANDEIVAKDQPYAKDASPIAQSHEYVPESDFEAHPEDRCVLFLNVEPGCKIWLWLISNHNNLESYQNESHNTLTVFASKELPAHQLFTKKLSSTGIMSFASSVITYTSVYTNFEPWRFYGGSDEEPADVSSLGVIIYGYDGLLMHPAALPSSDYVPGPEHLPSPDYVSGLEHPPSPVYVPEPKYSEYLVPSGDEAPIKDQPLPADASPTALSPGYVTDFNPDEDPKEDPEEDHTDYPTDGGDGDDEPFDDDDDDDEEEEEHLAPADSSAIHVINHVPLVGDIEAFETDEAQKTVRLEPPMSASMETRIAEHAATPTPPLPVSSPPLPLPSPLTTSPIDGGAPLGHREAGIRMRALLPYTSHRTNIPKAEMPPRKRACFTTPALELEVKESSTVGAARQPRPILEADLRRDRVGEMGYGITDTWDEIVEVMLEIASTTLEGVNQRVIELATTVRQDTKEFQKMAQKKKTTRTSPGTTTTLTTPITDAQLMALFARVVTAALAECDADMSRNDDDSHDSGTGGRRQVSTVRECTYTDFLKCQSINFKGTKGVVSLTQWLEKMKSVFYISSCTVACQVKFATCTLQGNALTWWNSHVRTVRHDVAYAMPWKTLKKMITYKYCPKELTLMCDRMFLEESDKVEKYVGGLPDMIHGSVNASNPKTMQEAIEFTTELMD
uniref:Reverse transcriptase domain-containing protein n=1 Tax=Tanacetum cinerariifolium TaxID=118510 RepID=A0A6L2MLT4_TANCI|nr:hypothetical protein [Tanacetum cinerariifolium]